MLPKKKKPVHVLKDVDFIEAKKTLPPKGLKSTFFDQLAEDSEVRTPRPICPPDASYHSFSRIMASWITAS